MIPVTVRFCAPTISHLGSVTYLAFKWARVVNLPFRRSRPRRVMALAYWPRHEHGSTFPDLSRDCRVISRKFLIGRKWRNCAGNASSAREPVNEPGHPGSAATSNPRYLPTYSPRALPWPRRPRVAHRAHRARGWRTYSLLLSWHVLGLVMGFVMVDRLCCLVSILVRPL